MSDNLTYEPAAKIHLTDRPPVACASCNGQYPERRHVDFGADYDGVSLPPEMLEGYTGTKFHHVDDLIICDECLTAGAAALGLGDLAEAEATLDDAVARIGELNIKLDQAVAYIESLEAAQKARQTLQEALAPPVEGKPRGRR